MTFIKHNAKYLWICLYKVKKNGLDIYQINDSSCSESGGWDWAYEGHIRDYKFACVIYFLKIKEIDIMIL